MQKMLVSLRQRVKNQSKVKSFLDRKDRNSKNSGKAYLLGLSKLQQFLDINNPGVDVNDIASIFHDHDKSVYDLLDMFVSYLITDCKLSAKSVDLYMTAVKGYLESCDIEINPTKFKSKVTIPKNHRQDEAAIDDNDIRKILLACNNARLKVYLLLLASGGMRAVEALAIRLKDIDFTTTPTKIHLRHEYTKTHVSRDVYISEEATTYLKQFIERKYATPVQPRNTLRIRNENGLLFQMQNRQNVKPPHLYDKLLLQFQRLLKSIGLEERKAGLDGRRKITFHSFRRFAKTVIATQTSTDYSEWFLGHAKSPYFVQKEVDRRLLYATKCMPFLTFINYSKLEHDATIKQTEMEMLMMKEANKDREIELLKQKLQVKDREIELLKNRDITHTDSMTEMGDKIDRLERIVEELQKRKET